MCDLLWDEFSFDGDNDKNTVEVDLERSQEFIETPGGLKSKIVT